MGRFALFVLGFAAFVALVAPRPNNVASRANDQSTKVISVDSGADHADASSTDSGASYGEVRLQRGQTGQFHVDAQVNGTSIPFLVDTGADMVALTIDDARRLGIYVNPYEFVPVGTGAGGALKGKPVMLNQVEIGGRTLSHVQAVVIEGLETNLLGQSVLREFGKVELSGDTMVIHT